MINDSILRLLRQHIVNIRREIETDDESDEWLEPHHLHELADAASGLAKAIWDGIGHSADAYKNASKGGP